MNTPDYHTVFEELPHACLLLQPDAPVFTIVEAINHCLGLLGKRRDAITGKPLFDVFCHHSTFKLTDSGLQRLQVSLQAISEYRAAAIIRETVLTQSERLARQETVLLQNHFFRILIKRLSLLVFSGARNW